MKLTIKVDTKQTKPVEVIKTKKDMTIIVNSKYPLTFKKLNKLLAELNLKPIKILTNKDLILTC